jgi:N-acetylmuramoyl-L-alanine amidase
LRQQKYDDGDVDYEANFHVLQQTRCPSVLIEAGFMTSYRDVKVYLNHMARIDYLIGLQTAVKRINNYEKNN